MSLITVNKSRFQKITVLIVLIIIVYFSASNREQPLLWLMAALLFSSLIAGLLWPYWLMHNLSVIRTGPERAKEGEAVIFNVEITNSGWMPRFMIEVVDRLPFVRGSQTVDSKTEKTLGVVAYIRAGGIQTFEAKIICENRGYYQLGPVSLLSSFPFGLTEVRQIKKGQLESLIVYPRVFPILSLPLLGCADEIHRGDVFLPEGSGVAEFSGLREYRHGDNPRHVHWLATARYNELMVMEFEPLASASLCIAMDVSKSANVGKGNHASFEYAVSIAASIAQYACHKNIPIQVQGVAELSEGHMMATGERHFQKILDSLAVIEVKENINYSGILHKVAIDCRYGQTIIVFLSQPESEVDAILQAVFQLKTRGARVLAIVFARETFLFKGPDNSCYLQGLSELRIPYFNIHKHDDLTELFNQ